MNLLFAVWALAGDPAPADALPDPQPERCEAFLPDLGDESDEVRRPDGLHYDQVSAALDAVIQHALGCGRPPGFTEVHMTFELVVGCDGLVESIVPVADGGAPSTYVECVAAVIRKADFPAHDMEDGMPVTYPVDVAW